jgi:hypothetical protein
MTKPITTEVMRNWLGSDHTDSDSLIQLLTDLINKDYSIERMRKDLFESDFNGESV